MSLSSKIISKLILRVALHLVFWITVFLFFNYFFGYASDIENFGYAFAIFLMPITMIVTYMFIYHLIPNYFFKKDYRRFALYTIFTLIISTYIIAMSIFFGLIYLSKSQDKDLPIASKSIVFFTVGVYSVVFLVSAFKLMRLQVTSAEQKSVLEQKILATQLKLKEQELNYLKMQIHPHFLFNSLNTIYGFALKKADEAPEMILRLSNLLDYVLYKVDKPLTAVTEEIHHIEDYIELEKLRFNDTIQVVFNKNDIPESLEIPPMLLLPFIENSFKHGAIKNGLLTIKIDLSYTNHSVQFSIENTNTKRDNNSHGIGLTNIKKRLDMLYKDAYILNIDDNDNSFKIYLTLKL